MSKLKLSTVQLELEHVDLKITGFYHPKESDVGLSSQFEIEQVFQTRGNLLDLIFQNLTFDDLIDKCVEQIESNNDN